MKRADRLFIGAVAAALALHWILTMRISKLEHRVDRALRALRQLEEEADG